MWLWHHLHPAGTTRLLALDCQHERQSVSGLGLLIPRLHMTWLLHILARTVNGRHPDLSPHTPRTQTLSSHDREATVCQLISASQHLHTPTFSMPFHHPSTSYWQSAPFPLMELPTCCQRHPKLFRVLCIWIKLHLHVLKASKTLNQSISNFRGKKHVLVTKRKSVGSYRRH